MTLLRGMMVASRSVLSALTLLALTTYVFSIIFHSVRLGDLLLRWLNWEKHFGERQTG